MTNTTINTWRTLKLGTGLKTAGDFESAFRQSGCYFSVSIVKIRQSWFIASDTETEVDLVVLSVEDLGFRHKVNRGDIYTKAIELGLQLCPPEVGPQLCLQYKDELEGELYIAMDPIMDQRDPTVPVDPMFSGDNVFFVTKERGKVILVAYYCLHNFTTYQTRWVFIKPRK